LAIEKIVANLRASGRLVPAEQGGPPPPDPKAPRTLSREEREKVLAGALERMAERAKTGSTGWEK
jgi:hypothetical protein